MYINEYFNSYMMKLIEWVPGGTTKLHHLMMILLESLGMCAADLQATSKVNLQTKSIASTSGQYGIFDPSILYPGQLDFLFVILTKLDFPYAMHQLCLIRIRTKIIM